MTRREKRQAAAKARKEGRRQLVYGLKAMRELNRWKIEGDRDPYLIECLFSQDGFLDCGWMKDLDLFGANFSDKSAVFYLPKRGVWAWSPDYSLSFRKILESVTA